MLSFRADEDCDPGELERFRSKVTNLASAANRFSDLLGERINPLRRQITNLDKSSTASKAAAYGSAIGERPELYPTPAKSLYKFIEETCKISILYIDAPKGISGAAYHHEDTDIIFINRTEPRFRRNFDLAHEFFHVLTWEKLPPGRDDWRNLKTRPKAEKLADSFAAGLLMPEKSMQEQWELRDDSIPLNKWIIKQSIDFDVSGQAFYWRLVNLNKIKKEQLDVDQCGRPENKPDTPKLFNESFVTKMHTVLDRGLVSARKTSELIDYDLDEFEPLFSSYNKSCPVAL